MDYNYEEYIPDHKSFYQLMESSSKDFMSYKAISFYGIHITYEEMFRQIDAVANALKAYGVQKDDIVASSLPGIPEGIFLLYAINKIGARYCAFDCRYRHEEVVSTVKTFSPKLCFIPDFQVKEFEGVDNCTVVHINPAHSVGKMSNVMSVFSDFFTGRCRVLAKQKNMVSYDKFMKKASQQPVATEISTDNIFGYFYTSGTTYGRKSIILTNENINAAVKQYAAALPEIQSGDSILNIMPLFTCYSVTIAVQLPLCMGVRVNLVPLINTKKLKKQLLKEKPNYIITVPAHWEHFMKENFDNCDLSPMKLICVGGDTMTPDIQDKLTDIFRRCNSNMRLIIGYGMSETASTAVARAFPCPRGSIGRPMKHMQIKICDPETGKELPANEKGEICIYGPVLCQGYYKDQEMTDRLLKMHDDGKVWLHSGDFGYLDEDGALFFCERIKRMYVRFDGTKISPYDIECGIAACPIVSRCMVVAIRDTDHSHGMCAKALIILEDGVDKNEAKRKIDSYIKKHIDMHMVPKEVVFVDKFPYTKNGKLDYFSAQYME